MVMRVDRALRRAVPAMLGLIVVLSGCSPSDQQAAQRAANDAIIVGQVRARAAAIDAATLTLVSVTCTAGVVTLTGEVPTAKERRDIVTSALAVSGVRNVTDRIAINPHAPTAAEIAADITLAGQIRAALAAQIGVNAANVHVDVHHGVVTLTGSLPSAAHREIADSTVRAIPGVRHLSDKITIAGR